MEEKQKEADVREKRQTPLMLVVVLMLVASVACSTQAPAPPAAETGAAAEPAADPNAPSFRFIQANGIRMRIAEMGKGPLVVLLHGFPESWYSWRHQLPALAKAGYHAVAPDLRGYGKTDKPAAVED